ncbi:hypothetical protein [uncultured Pseudoalteromonas sp.]|uniref:hypothetical protein n=1 Tax=uncultured Pseudoalteromonas sp. TaxID=114053 RepID=UPI0025983970|nr:hypothetical protein [uncultured Pseudoalteromonas sp.]
MDTADSAQIEIEHHEALQIANLKRPDVVPTDECVECGNEISEGRKKAIKTNLCIGCAELFEIKRKQFR